MVPRKSGWTKKVMPPVPDEENPIPRVESLDTWFALQEARLKRTLDEMERIIKERRFRDMKE